MKGTFDSIYKRLKSSYDEAIAHSQFKSLYRPPSKTKIIGDLAGAIPTNVFGKDYFGAMLIVLEAHWYVCFVLDLRISQYFLPQKELPRRTHLIFGILSQTPLPVKLHFLRDYSLLPSKQVDRLERINSARNAFAHFYQPGQKKLTYKGHSLVSEEGLESFWKDCEEVLSACKEEVDAVGGS